MSETFAKNIECILCQETYSPVIEPESGKSGYKVHCSSCSQWIPITRGDPVRVTLREVLGVRGEALALAVQSVLFPCACGSKFNHDAGKRCPSCIKKIEWENRRVQNDKNEEFHCPWDLEELKKLEPKIFQYIFQKMDSKAETLTQLIQKFEAGEIDAETYMEALESLQLRESTQICAIQTWAMILGPDLAFRAAEEHGLVEKYGTRILVTIADGLAISTGHSVLATLSREKTNWDGVVQKELRTFLSKIGGGF
ncbi:MAG: hypothetical protein ACE5E9_13825 [Nitrospinaceae bacterium]